MSKYCQLVIGTAGCGKSTYCKLMQDHYKLMKRNVNIVNLDPGAEVFAYDPIIDVRDLISVQDVMEDGFGPNGAAVYCMEHLESEFEWMKEKLEEADFDSDYILIDCPGQPELYINSNFMKNFIEVLKSWDYRVLFVYVMDTKFGMDPFNLVAAMMTCNATLHRLGFVECMVAVMKVDLMDAKSRERFDEIFDFEVLADRIDEVEETPCNEKRIQMSKYWLGTRCEARSPQFMPVDPRDPSTVTDIVHMIDGLLFEVDDREHVEPRDMEFFDKDGAVEME